ncbi:YadA family autotransporter adhesin [Burkholderia sp. ABCPW 14]|uniref:YadA family autotransporter adhesin n=1 Tax=Burkholderia sp. ABCPW 14 TaxID=1637860 RepID=UPI0018D22597|nr:YadA-like family protein [Burkholderia sp. ABCPW 14]
MKKPTKELYRILNFPDYILEDERRKIVDKYMNARDEYLRGVDGDPRDPPPVAIGQSDDKMGSEWDNWLHDTATDIIHEIANISNGEAGLVQEDAETGVIRVAKETGGAEVDFASQNTEGEMRTRRLTGIAEGTSDDDAATFGQLRAVKSMTDQNTTDIAAASTLASANALAMAKALGGGAIVDVNDKITAPSYTVGGTEMNNVGDALANLDGRTTSNTDAITSITDQISNISNGEVGPAQQDADTKVITVAAATGGASIDVSGTDGVRALSGVKEATLSDTSTEAVTGKQLNATNTALGALQASAVRYDNAGKSSITFNSGGSAVQLKNVADGTENSDAVNLGQLKNAGMMKEDGSSNAVTYGDTDKSTVELAGSDGTTLTNVKAGSVTAASTDAVNGGQLYGAYQSSAEALGGGATISANGVWNGPSYTFASGTSFNNVGDALGNLDQRVSTLESGGSPDNGNPANNGMFDGQGANRESQETAQASGTFPTASGAHIVASGSNSTASGANAVASADNSVALGADSVADRANSVSVGAAGGERQITNVAAGMAPTDAANLRQVNHALASANRYTDSSVQSLSNTMNQRFDDTNRAINQVAMSAYAGIAAAMAMPNMMPSGPGKTIVAAGGATYKGGGAMAAGATYRSRDGKWLVNGAVSATSMGDAGVRAQVGYEF